jgi:hypothetical protein
MQAVTQPQLVKTASVKGQRKAVPPRVVARPSASRKPVRRFLDFLMVALSAPEI